MTSNEATKLAYSAGIIVEKIHLWNGTTHVEAGTTIETDLAALVQFAQLVAERERELCAIIAETPVSGEQDDITMAAKDRVAAAIRARSDK